MNSSGFTSVTEGIPESDVASDHSSTVSTSTLNTSSADDPSATKSGSNEVVDPAQSCDSKTKSVLSVDGDEESSSDSVSVKSDSPAIQSQVVESTCKPNVPVSQSIHPDEYIYHIKRIRFRGKSKPIITQNENGPCPLIAITNVLLLQEFVSLPENSEMVTGERLIAKLSDLLLSKSVKGLDTGQLLNYETTVSDALNLFPSLQTGLDVNVRFTGVSAFEFTSVLGVFDLFGITLYHGWLVDPTELELASVVGDRTYNQLVEQIIHLKASSNPEDVRKGLLADTFLEQTASQLTYHGLYELTVALAEGQLAVLFRNNHFSTIIKNQGRIYVLVTDLGLLNEPNIVWEALDDVDGNTQFVDATFRLYSPNASTNDLEYESSRIPTSRPVAGERTGATKSAASTVKSALLRTFTGSGSKDDDKSSGLAKGAVGGALKGNRQLSVEELARACSKHLKIETESDHVPDSDLSLAARLQLEEIESSKSGSRVIVVRQDEVSKRALKSTSHSPLSADDLTQVCSEDLLEQARMELGTGSDLDLAMQLQFEEVQRSNQTGTANRLATRRPGDPESRAPVSPNRVSQRQRPTSTVTVDPTASSPRHQSRNHPANSKAAASVPVATHRPNDEDKSSCVVM